MFIHWLGDKITDWSVWEVEYVKFHTVVGFKRSDGSQQDTTVMYVSCTKEQLEKLFKDNGRDNMQPLCSVLGLKVFPLYPNVIHWVWRYGSFEEVFNRFEIRDNAEAVPR